VQHRPSRLTKTWLAAIGPPGVPLASPPIDRYRTLRQGLLLGGFQHHRDRTARLRLLASSMPVEAAPGKVSAVALLLTA